MKEHTGAGRNIQALEGTVSQCRLTQITIKKGGDTQIWADNLPNDLSMLDSSDMEGSSLL